MKFEISEKLKNIEPYSPTSEEYKIRMDANESFVLPDENLVLKIQQEISKISLNRYPDSMAINLCQAFSDYYIVDKSLVTAFNGSDESIFLILSAFLEKRDKALIFTPDFSMYEFYCGLLGAKVIRMKKDEKFELDFNAASRIIEEEKIKLCIFSNPCNPTSVGFDREQVKAFIKAVSALVIVDEAYMDFFDQSLIEDVDSFENLIVLRTCSKAIGLAAARLGFAISNATLTQVLRAVKSPYNVNSISAAVGKVVLSDEEFLKKSLRTIMKSRDYLFEKLKAVESNDFNVFKSNTNFIFISCKNADYIDSFLRENSIAVRNIAGGLRITAGKKEENDILFEKICEYRRKKDEKI